VHFVTPELWEVRKPTKFSIHEHYIRNIVNWHKLFDNYVPVPEDSINVVPEALSNALSVTQLGEQNPAPYRLSPGVSYQIILTSPCP
jgi:hypothetical protein